MATELRDDSRRTAEQTEKLVKEKLPHWIAETPELRRGLIHALNATATDTMSYEAFMAQVHDVHAEWVNGAVVEMTPVSGTHQDIVGFLYKIMHTYAEHHNLGLVRAAPFQMKLQNGREPDLLFIATDHLARLTDTYLDGPADIAVEVVSPESIARDRGEKFYEYAQGGVPEYWLIDPQAKWAEFHLLDGQFYRPAFSGNEGTYSSPSMPGFWLQVEWLWQEPLPKTMDVLHELGLL